ncbi:hypothetical protein L249_2613 [Ophiocordyceps polyrhachis-furcata BCC 54312]|uniref:Protein YOP1 n=1 Tax=Ophiocordyceps polyrhachis-furcata BCC 54312 TaxID=1330021 RepID=A0A367LSV1_9HYPO|nr:hypothetical protein L249_2613 [Ophiocordyceps polyrhachis-furcata BCC 54312]
MFDLFAMLLSSITSFLFPIFASYKALKTSDPAQLTPWLMYWVVFNCCLLAESWVSFILAWIPFYGYIRFFFFLYLILPQTQGARIIYEQRIHPFLEENEGTIDKLIATTHQRLRTAGSTYLRKVIDYLKTNILGLPRTEQPPPSPPSGPAGYTQSLLARFSVPTARLPAATYTGNDFYNMLANAVSAAAGRAATDSGPLIPPDLRGSAEKMSFIAAQRERLNILLSALDREAQELQRADADAADANRDEAGSSRRRPSGGGLSKSRSETDFEKVEAESGDEDGDGTLRRRQVPAGASGSWIPWAWAGSTAKGSSHED